MTNSKHDSPCVVSVVQAHVPDYPDSPPFHPPQAYPELPWKDVDLQEDSQVYHMVRTAFINLGLDKAHVGTPAWNPLGDIIRKGDFVLIKPNFVTDYHPLYGRDKPCDGREGVIVHGSILRAVADYAFLATGATGRIVIAENTMHTTPLSTFQNNLTNTGTQAVVEYLQRQGVPICAYDLRTEAPPAGRARGAIPQGDPLGSTLIDLGSDSEYAGIDSPGRCAFNQWDVTTPRRHHDGAKHEYSISNTVLRADAIISVPKLKTHAKVGVSVALKNTFGISNQKNWVPHFRQGTPAHGGDERERAYTRGESLIQWVKTRQILRKSVRLLGLLGINCCPESQTGSWYGNDTVWRGVLDLNKILFYADRQGVLRPQRQRQYLAVVDGIIAGEGEGPLTPTARNCGTILAATDPIAADIVAAGMMGFDYTKLRLIMKALTLKKHPIGLDHPEYLRVVGSCATAVPAFRPPRSWTGRIEK